jgi:hypothetical protein
MSKPEYKILLTTSDKYIHAVLPFAWLLKKYWPNHPDVIVGGFAPPQFKMPPGFAFMSLGDQDDYPLNKWSNAFKNLIDRASQDVFIFMLEDMWIIEPVKENVVNMAHDYMNQFEYVARLDLTGDRLHSGQARMYGKLGGINLVWSSPDSQYHMSTMPAFWRKEHLLKVLKMDETPWQLELDGTPRLRELQNSVIVLGTDAWPIKNTLAFRSGDHTQMLLDEIDKEDVKEMRRLKLI